MDNTNLVYKTQFTVRVHDVDMHQRCSPIGVLRLIHEAAMEQTLKIKVSAVELARENLGWVVIAQQLEFFKDAHLGDVLTIITYPSRIEKIFTYRHYVVLNKDNEIVAQSVGKFIMMDLGTRRMVGIPEHIKDMLQDLPQLYQIEEPPRIKLSGTKPIVEREYNVRFSDLDFNKHVGNRSYYNWIFDSFDYDFLKQHILGKINFEFKSEVHISEKVKSGIFNISEQKFEHRLQESGRSVAFATTDWRIIS